MKLKKKTVSGVTALTMLVSATLPTHASKIEEVNGMQEAVESEVIVEEVVQPEVVIKSEVVPIESKLEETPEVAPIATILEVGSYAE